MLPLGTAPINLIGADRVDLAVLLRAASIGLMSFRNLQWLQTARDLSAQISSKVLRYGIPWVSTRIETLGHCSDVVEKNDTSRFSSNCFVVTRSGSSVAVRKHTCCSTRTPPTWLHPTTSRYNTCGSSQEEVLTKQSKVYDLLVTAPLKKVLLCQVCALPSSQPGSLVELKCLVRSARDVQLLISLSRAGLGLWEHHAD
jgi:hypothetical protein